MRCHHVKLLGISLAAIVTLSGCKTSGRLAVNSVNYQAIRTKFAQPTSIAPEAKIAVEYFFNSKGVMQPVVYNLTDEVLVLDQTKSFVIMPDGSSVSYYDPTVRTTTTGTFESHTQGTSFNLGGVTRALGIGGVAGALASSTTVGSSSTFGMMRQNTVSITDQPRVLIGPKGSVAMSKAYKIKGIGETAQGLDMVDVEPSLSPVRFSVCVTYSVDDGATFDKLVTEFYVSSQLLVPVRDKKVSNAFYNIYSRKPDALAENMYLFMIRDNIKKSNVRTSGEFITHDNVYDTYLQGSLIDFQ